ncbi:Detected protein of unknown function [Hibiscus syriacus]|uniref:Uncharacterized protein n=1 Tax=Hibiscus syriacus TaxID=106335 RepID=A0A6A3AXE7_HIBSY|nr:polyribonucleotide nucleotidyltransferase-like [Hibiscus syriacus]KAE8708107.1 Detected protein of unknown function [Hibiscus syriacus]
MTEFSLAVAEKKTQFSTLLLSNFMLFCSYILSNPLYFSYFVFFSPYLFNIFSFLSPLFGTTSLLFLALFTVLRSQVVDNECDGLPCLEELEAYKIVFEASTIEEIRENPDGVLGSEAIVDCLQAVDELEDASVHKPETLTTGASDEESGEISRPETVQVNAVVKIFEELLKEKDAVENLSSEKGEKEEKSEAMGSKVNDPEATVGTKKGGELEDKAMVNSQSVTSETTGLSYLGSMRKEKEWKRTLACKLFEERHKVTAATDGGGGEGMDLLWEAYESSDSNKSKLKSVGWKGKKGGNGIDDDDDDDDYEEESDGHLCCLQALKFSTGKMNLGMGRPNFVKISKALKGFGWLHHVGTTKHAKKAYY